MYMCNLSLQTSIKVFCRAASGEVVEEEGSHKKHKKKEKKHKKEKHKHKKDKTSKHDREEQDEQDQQQQQQAEDQQGGVEDAGQTVAGRCGVVLCDQIRDLVSSNKGFWCD